MKIYTNNGNSYIEINMIKEELEQLAKLKVEENKQKVLESLKKGDN